MVELDGEAYQLQTPTECAYDCVNYINQYCSDHNIVNSKGEPIYIDISPTNILYVVIFGISYLICIIQKLIYSVACGFNYTNASERQLLNLAKLAGVTRKQATKTTVSGTVWASFTEPLLITTEQTCTVSVGGSTVVFSPYYEINIEAGSSAKIIFEADIYGAYSIPVDTLSFDSTIPGLRLMSTKISVPGTEVESIADLRKRLIYKKDNFTNLDNCIDAISRLEGIAKCSIIYNVNNTLSTTLGNIQIPPRQSLIMIQGYNDNIAKTYLSYMTALTVNTGEFSQNYITAAGQSIPVYYTTPISITTYVRIYVTGTYTDNVKNEIKNILLILFANVGIGASVSVNDILKYLNTNNFSGDVDFDNADISIDGINYTYIAKPLASHILSLVYENIQVVENI